MNKSLMLTLAASAAAFVAAPAQAAQFTLTGLDNGEGETTYQIDRITKSASTTDYYHFTTAKAGMVTIGLINTGVNTSNVDFIAASLNGSTDGFTIVNSGVLSTVYTLAQLPVLAGLNTFAIKYKAGSKTATYNGNITFSAPAVPEPATWAMLMLGVGLIGAAFRARKSQPSYKMAVSYS